MEVAKPLFVAKQRRARAPWVFEMGPVTLTFAAIVLVSVTSLLYLTQASRVAATGYDISSAEETRGRLERQQQLLLSKAAELQSLKRVEADATSKLGMVPAPPPDFVTAKDPPVDVEDALRQALARAQHRPASFWQRLLVAVQPRPRSS